jgi:GrpB-like predicted nucleotidyltransferase (UPF0157 family)
VSRDKKFILADSPEMFEEANAFADAAAEQLRSILGPEVEIRHIGATAVPGCLTKGDVDLAVRVDQASFASVRAILDKHYAKNLESPRDDSFASYADDTGAIPLGIQLVVRSSEHDTFNRFLGRLKQSDVVLASYNALKRSLSGADMEIYRQAKADFIARTLAESGE